MRILFIFASLKMNNDAQVGQGVAAGARGNVMSKVATIWGIAGTIAAGLATWSGGAAAQSLATNPQVEIRNTGDETRKLCLHKDKDITLFAKGCLTIGPGETLLWDRKGEFTPFKIKVYEKRKLLDKYLYTRSLPGDTGRIIVGSGGRFGFSRFQNIAKKFSLRMCNTQYDDPVYVAIGLDYADRKLSEGWFSIARGRCIDVPISQRAKDNWNMPYSKIPRIYYYARTYGEKPVYWNRGANAQTFCLDQGKRFTASIGGSRTCAEGAGPQTYRYLSAPTESSSAVQMLNF